MVAQALPSRSGNRYRGKSERGRNISNARIRIADCRYSRVDTSTTARRTRDLSWTGLTDFCDKTFRAPSNPRRVLRPEVYMFSRIHRGSSDKFHGTIAPHALATIRSGVACFSRETSVTHIPFKLSMQSADDTSRRTLRTALIPEGVPGKSPYRNAVRCTRFDRAYV